MRGACPSFFTASELLSVLKISDEVKDDLVTFNTSRIMFFLAPCSARNATDCDDNSHRIVTSVGAVPAARAGFRGIIGHERITEFLAEIDGSDCQEARTGEEDARDDEAIAIPDVTDGDAIGCAG